MDQTYTDLVDGRRIEMAVDFVTRRTIDIEGAIIERLRVADETGRTFSILTTADATKPVGLKTGERHHVSGLLGAAPIDDRDADLGTCPHCHGRLRTGETLDTAGSAVVSAVEQLDLTEPFGILDARTTIERVREERASEIDDWQPMSEESSLDIPSFVCTACGRHVDRSEHAHAGRNDEHLQEFQAQANAAPASSETLGMAAGGAKDVGNFRENVANGYTPQPEAISDEGLFYDYHFETGDRVQTEALFAPRYAAGCSEHPLTGDVERYLSVGLDSTLSVDEFERPRLDLVAVLDVSGSMSSQFDSYYYDEHGGRHEREGDSTTKLAAATRSLCALTEQLRPDDRLGIILYNNSAHVAKPLRDVETTNMSAIRRHIREVAAGGGTNLAAGFDAAVDLLEGAQPAPEVERRVVFMTDMMPNTGRTGESELTELFADAATEGIHTTFIGMGLDANADLAETLSGIRGANHYFINSPAEFERRLGAEFDYMVTPLVYDLTLELDAEGYDLEAVHGSPSAEAATDRLMHVGTLFPSAKEDGEARGGVVLLRLAQTASEADIDLVASWTERGGGEYTERVSVEMPAETESYDHTGVRKSIALARYARALRSWARAVRSSDGEQPGVDDWQPSSDLEEHERQSVPLMVSRGDAERFDRLRQYLENEINAVGDETMRQEVELLETLCQAAASTAAEVSD